LSVFYNEEYIKQKERDTPYAPNIARLPAENRIISERC